MRFMSPQIDQMMRELEILRRPVRSPKSFRSLRRRRKAKRFLRSHPWTDTIINMTDKNNEFFLASSDVSDHIKTKLIFRREDKNTLMQELTLLGTSKQWNDFVNAHYNDDEHRIVHFSTSNMFVIDLTNDSWMDCTLNANAITIRFYGTDKEIEKFINECSTKFEIADSYIEWMYSTDGSSVNVPLRTDRTPLSVMYPFLGEESIEEYYDRFLRSDASILLLIGPPGTGKTTFIRGFLQHTKSSAIVTYDAAILEKDYVFAQFIEGEANVMVMEDADTFLKARSDGNSMMHRFLNVGDGLVTTKGKKLIFSTNLPSIRDVDAALIRPGRCFDIVSFDLLTQEQAEAVASEAGITIGTKDKWTVAEIFNGEVQKHENKPVGRKVGFV